MKTFEDYLFNKISNELDDAVDYHIWTIMRHQLRPAILKDDKPNYLESNINNDVNVAVLNILDPMERVLKQGLGVDVEEWGIDE